MCSFCQSLKDHISDNIYLINQLYNYCLIGVVPIHTMYKQYIYGCSPSSIGSIINVLPSFLINSINGFFLEIWMIPTSMLLLFYWNLSEFFINKSDIELFDTIVKNANACIFYWSWNRMTSKRSILTKFKVEFVVYCLFH